MAARLQTPLVPLSGFGPDMPSTAAGYLRAVTNFIPTNAGMSGAPTATAQTSALPAASRGAVLAEDISGTRRIFAGTSSNLYILSGTSWTSVSRSGGYSLASDGVWSFAQFGNATIGANDSSVLQASVGGGSFADISGAPTAKIVVTSPNFVMALNTSDGTYGDQGDRWWCSAINDHTSWTPSVTTQATTGRVIGDGGDITAGARYGLGLVAFKARSMFLASYVGSPVVWQFDRIPGDVGCVGPRALCDAAGLLVFVGEDNIMAFDGTRPRPIGDGVVRAWFLNDLSPTQKHRTILQYEPSSGRVWIFYCSTANGASSAPGTPDKALVWHIARNAWGLVSLQVDAGLMFTSPTSTMDALSSTFDGLPVESWDSQIWLTGGRSMAVFGADRILSSLTGGSSSSSFTTGDYGDDDGATMVRHMRLRYSRLPTTATATGYTKAVTYDGSAAPVSSGSINDGKFDCRQSGRWHSFKCDFTGDVEVLGVLVDAAPSGRR